MKQEKLPWLADSPFYTKRFAFFLGRRCRTATIRDVAREVHLDWKTVKDLENEYMGAQLRRAGHPAPKALGIDEISIRKGHTYRIVVSDLGRRRPIWFGGEDRPEQSRVGNFHPLAGGPQAHELITVCLPRPGNRCFKLSIVPAGGYGSSTP